VRGGYAVPPPAQEDPVYEKELTLAQRFGLVERPPAKLTAAQWDAVHEKSAGRNDSCDGPAFVCLALCLQESQITSLPSQGQWRGCFL